MIGELKSLQKTVAAAGTAVALSATKVLAYGVVIKALPANVGNVAVGGSTVLMANGFVLDASEGLKMSDLDIPKGVPVDLSKIYVDAATNDDGVCVSYVETFLG